MPHPYTVTGSEPEFTFLLSSVGVKSTGPTIPSFLFFLIFSNEIRLYLNLNFYKTLKSFIKKDLCYFEHASVLLPLGIVVKLFVNLDLKFNVLNVVFAVLVF